MYFNFKHDREQQSSRFPDPQAALLMFESARGSVPDGRPARKAGKHGERISLFWRVFGGTLLSIAALVIITLTQQFANILTEVRQDLNRMHESRGGLARREELDMILKELQAGATGIAGLRERSLRLEQQLTAAEAEGGQLARELHDLRARLAEVVGRLNARGPANGQCEPSAAR